jgi:ABC-type sugar transport system ATPase subunit
MTLGQRVAVLNAGRLQQVAAPRALYDRPANAFVAGFIGNPPMNLLPGRLVADASGGTQVAVAGGTLALATQPARNLGGETDVTVGIRPEALTLAADGAPGTLRATVEHVEWLGHETLAHVRAAEGDARLVARLPGMHALTPGQPIALAVAPAHVRLFGADGGALD